MSQCKIHGEPVEILKNYLCYSEPNLCDRVAKGDLIISSDEAKRP